MSRLNKLVLKIEREIFFLTGVTLPTLRNQWEDDAKSIQSDLDKDRNARLHQTCYTNSMFFSKSK